jgi:hypothetical protein
MERYRLSQTHCLRCEREVAALLRADARRHAPRWPIAKDLSGALT